MTYKTILVHMDASGHSDARLDFAIDFASRHDEHVAACTWCVRT